MALYQSKFSGFQVDEAVNWVYLNASQVSKNTTQIAANKTAIEGLTQNKQDKLTAGEGIQITEQAGKLTITSRIADYKLFEVVTSLPATGKPNIIYLKSSDPSEGENKYIEYVWITTPTPHWEKFGEFKAATDLTGYIDTTELNEELLKYYTKSSADLQFVKKTIYDAKISELTTKDNTQQGLIDANSSGLQGVKDDITRNIKPKLDDTTKRLDDYLGTTNAKLEPRVIAAEEKLNQVFGIDGYELVLFKDAPKTAEEAKTMGKDLKA